MGSHAMTWLVVLGLVATGVGCSGTHEELVESQQLVDQPASTLEAAGESTAVLLAPQLLDVESLANPLIELTRETEEQVKDYVSAAKRMLNEHDLETTAVLQGGACA